MTDHIDNYVHLEGCTCLFMGDPNDGPLPREDTVFTTVLELITCPLCQIMAK